MTPKRPKNLGKMTSVQKSDSEMHLTASQQSSSAIASSASLQSGYKLLDGSKAYYRFSDIMFEVSDPKSLQLGTATHIRSRSLVAQENESVPSQRRQVTPQLRSSRRAYPSFTPESRGRRTGRLLCRSVRFSISSHSTFADTNTMTSHSHLSGWQAESVHDIQTGGIPRLLDR